MKNFLSIQRITPLIVALLVLSLSSFAQERAKSNASNSVYRAQLALDSVTAKLTHLQKEILYSRQQDSIEFQTQLANQQRRFDDVLSTALSISASNVGNTIQFLALILAALVAIVGLLGFAGKLYLGKIQQGINLKFDQKSKEVEISVEESRVLFYLTSREFYALAVASLQKILTLDSNNFFAHEKLGFLFLGDVLNQPERAVHHNKAAIHSKPNELFPYINLQIALDHAKHPFDEIEAAFNKLMYMAKQIGADEMTYGKAKLFFADNIRHTAPDKKEQARTLYKEALQHFSKVLDEQRLVERDRWSNQANEGLRNLGD